MLRLIVDAVLDLFDQVMHWTLNTGRLTLGQWLMALLLGGLVLLTVWRLLAE